eukprot:6110769-Prymnesium_polylepis.1
MGLSTTRGQLFARSCWSAAGGSVLGGAISVVVNNALIEISVTPFCARARPTGASRFARAAAAVPTACARPHRSRAVSIIFGLVLLLLGTLMIWRKLWEQHEQSLARVLVLSFSTLVLLSGLSCFLLEACATRPAPDGARAPRASVPRVDGKHSLRPTRTHRSGAPQKDWFKRIPPKAKVPMYMALGVSLCFAVSFSVVDLINLYADRCGQSRMPLVSSSAQIFLVLAGAVAMGAAFGLIFGVMDVEDDISRRAAAVATPRPADAVAAAPARTPALPARAPAPPHRQ